VKSLRDKTFFSATDICNFSDCKYLTFKSLYDTPAEETADEQKEMILQKGLEHEAAYLRSLEKDGSVVTKVCEEGKRHPVQEFHETLKHLKDGKRYIAQAMLTHERLSGIADLLRRVEVPSNLGSYSYEVVDTKLGKKQKASYLLQLCFYGALLEQVQGIFPKYGYIVDGNGKEHRYNLTKCREYFKRLRDEFLRTIDSENVETINPEPCRKCSTCYWSSHCEQRWSDERHLSLVARITSSQRKRLREAGIQTIDDLAKADSTAPQTIQGLVYDRLREQAVLQCSPKKPVYRFIHPSKGGTGFCDLPPGSSGDLFYDIEADPLIKAQALDDAELKLRDGLEYLHGMCYRNSKGEPGFKYFLAKDKVEERIRYEELIQFFWKRTREDPHAHIYHYSAYEMAALARLNSQYPSQQEYLTDLLREDRFVDLYRVVRNSVRVSEPKYSIKNLEVFFAREGRTQDVKGGADSIVAFEKWLKTGDQAIIDDIIAYNEKDCISTIELFDWLHRLKIEAAQQLGVNWEYEAARRAEALDDESTEERERRQEEARQRVEKYYNHFSVEELLEKDDEELSLNQSVRKKLFYLADFYRQENKPLWWEFFSLRKDPEKRPLSAETLTNCSLREIQPPTGRKKNPAAIYQAHVQSMAETKMKKGDSIYDLDHRKKIGTLEEIDRDAKTLLIRVSKDAQVEDAVDLTVYPSPKTNELQAGVERFIEKMMELPSEALTSPKASLPYAPLLDVLFKSVPRFSDDCYAERIVSVPASHDDFPKQLLSACEALARSYLFIQGPPGTGKTYHGSRLVLSLLQKGYKVGITSNSHKAINNFLQELEHAAHENKVPFKGAKKSDDKNESTWYEPRDPRNSGLITNRFKTHEIQLSEYDVLAGTPWLFVDSKFDEQIDYLLVDEASQLSIAHLVAAGLCARNLILIGDPQQLPQPLQGQHQAELDQSPLQLLLGDAQVVPPQSGVFLETSRRMHTRICDVLSEHVYDGKLTAPAANQYHAIINPSPSRITRESGILFVECKHQNNTTISKQEVSLIAELVAELRRCSFQAKLGDIKPLQAKDIMVVSPYNLQVNLLIEHLQSAEIGTIDKFQGREAPVAIISMTASDVNEAPRGLDFLFNINRLNVALSRAKALAIIVASPELLRTRCKSIEQIELVNFFCALAATGE
jgi:predicted RecB family nuclease